jgi:hypothetical protein
LFRDESAKIYLVVFQTCGASGRWVAYGSKTDPAGTSALARKAACGGVIFQIDRARFALALQQADAVVAGRCASFDQAESDLKRYRQLTTLAVSQQRQEQVLASEQQAKAANDQVVADGLPIDAAKSA